MIARVVGSVWTAPRAPGAPGPRPRDWALVGVLVCVAVLEAALRRDVPWRPLAAVESVGLALLLPWRRVQPLAVLVTAFGVGTATDVVAVAVHGPRQVGLYTTAFLLLLPYTLFRWGSGRETLAGAAVALGAYGWGIVEDHTPRPDSIAAFVVLALPAVLGLSTRFWEVSRQRELEQVRFRERAQLARELHDTVAHHVSAMVIRAQAGRVLAETQPAAAVEALRIVEAEGSRTLAEMRAMVGALRDGDDPELAPVGGLADLERLARSGGAGPGVQVEVGVAADGVSRATGAALYRIAQEAVTNALRHARHAGRVLVEVTDRDGELRLTVRDDGDQVTGSRAAEGYGIIGMTERAKLLGGTLEAGPGPDRGWVVRAVLPREGLPG